MRQRVAVPLPRIGRQADDAAATTGRTSSYSLFDHQTHHHSRAASSSFPLDVRDSTGALVDFNRTHRFRHTVATGLQAVSAARVVAAVPQTFHADHHPPRRKCCSPPPRREFLRHRKLTADSREIEIHNLLVAVI